jgi:hypothetical protein
LFLSNLEAFGNPDKGDAAIHAKFFAIEGQGSLYRTNALLFRIVNEP